MTLSIWESIKSWLGYKSVPRNGGTPDRAPFGEGEVFESISLDGEINIRSMRIEDIEQVHDIDVLSFPTPWPSSSYRFELMDNPTSLSWVAEMALPGGKTRVIGMIVVWLVTEEAHIATIAVHPNYRGRGVARKLLATCLQVTACKGAKRSTLEVRAGNMIAQSLYRSFGFQVAGHRPRYYQDNNEDALIMTLYDMDPRHMGGCD